MIYIAKFLQHSRSILKRIGHARYKIYCRILIVAGILIIVSYAMLPLKKPNFFSHISARDHRKDLSRYIYQYPNTYRSVKSQYKILLWTPYFGSEDWDLENLTRVFSTCPVSNCVLSYNKSELTSSDVLLFHTRDIYSLGHTTYYALPKYRTNDQLWVLYDQESPVNEVLDFSKFNGVFNWTGTYHKASEIHIPYGHVHKTSKTEVAKDAAANDKRTGVVWIASNCHAHSRRQMLVNELQKYIEVDKFGSCGSEKLPRSSVEKVLSNYKFYLSFENSVCDEYITEKFFGALRKGILPVVYGGGNYKEIAPPHSYIDIRDFSNAQEISEYLKYLERNNTAYNAYFAWTKDYEVIMNDDWCRLCQTVNEKRIPHQVYTDINGWFNAGTCKQLTWAEEFFQLI